MGAMLVCWALFPALLAALSLGCGLALERATGWRLSTALLLPAGFATLIALAGLPILVSPLARLATPLVVAVAIVGLVFGRLTHHSLGAPAAVAVVTFLIYGIPVILTGQATFLGFLKLDDTATWLGLTDWVMYHGRDVSGLAPSTFEFMIKNYVGNGYPVGAFLPMGIGHVLVRQDVAWLFQPTISYGAAMLSLSLYGLVEPLVRRPLIRGTIAVAGAMPALLIGYAWWGSIKEVAAAALIALVVAFAAPLLSGWYGVRRLIPLGVALAALVGVLSAGGIVWVLPALVPATIALVHRYRHRLWSALRRYALVVVAATAAAVVLLLPALATISKFAGPGGVQFSTSQDLGILTGPLSALHAFGIWPAGDLRAPSVNAPATDVLIGVAIVAAAAGLALAWRARGWQLVLYAITSLVAGAGIYFTAGPWVAAKALALASPAVPLCALAGAGILYERGRRLEGAVIAVVVAGGIVWSNVLQYHAVNPAPRAQLLELQQIAKLIPGQGPTLLTSFDPYAARHFLRNADPEELSDLRRRLVFLRSGGIAPSGTHEDLDAIQLADVLVYRTLVTRTSPVASRPPSPYHLVWKGRFYEVWQRPDSFPRILRHVPLGNVDDAADVPPCARILSLARTPGATRLAYVPRDQIVRVALAGLPLPNGWSPSSQFPDIAYLGPAGRLDAEITVPHSGVYRAWVGNSFRAELRLLVDGRDVGSGRDDLNSAEGYTPFGLLALRPGSHLLSVIYSGPDWRPGSGGPPPLTGPIVLGDETADRAVSYVAPRDARSLCGKRLDWVEALA